MCEDDAEQRAFILDLFRGADMTKALVVEDALFCGRCTVRPDPMPLPELDR